MFEEECSNNYNMHREYAMHLGSVPSRGQNQDATEAESSNNHNMHREYAMNLQSTHTSCQQPSSSSLVFLDGNVIVSLYF